MKNAKFEGLPADQYEVHCTVCGARLGFYNKGSLGNMVPCCRCKSNLSFMVLDGEMIVRSRKEKG